jgi:hypothetical protein
MGGKTRNGRLEGRKGKGKGRREKERDRERRRLIIHGFRTQLARTPAHAEKPNRTLTGNLHIQRTLQRQENIESIRRIAVSKPHRVLVHSLLAAVYKFRG